MTNRCFLYHPEEETIAYCAKTRILWQLLFTLFRASWIVPYSVKETLLGWNGTVVGKGRKKAWKAAPLRMLWIVCKVRNRIDFDNVDLLVQKMENSFLCNLWFWTRVSIEERPNSLMSFIDGLGSNWGKVMFFVLPHSLLFEPSRN